MYNRNRRPGFRPNGSFQGPRRSTFKVKKIDSNLFIKKASDEVDIHTSQSAAKFSDFPFTEQIKRNILIRGYDTPTRIQEEAIPHILAGSDIIGIANTGSGKTAAFLIPLINKLYNERGEKALIVVPTRELALQIFDEFTQFAKNTHMQAVLCIGGTNLARQEERLRNNPQFIIGTPGRLKDLIQRKKLHLGNFRNVVLDEVDLMVDIGFIRDIQYFISLLPQNRQSLFFSATVDEKTKTILAQFVRNPVTVSVKKQDTSANIDQDIIKINGGKSKIDVLHDLLITDGYEKVLVFGRTKWGVEKLAKMLNERGFKVTSIHGNRSQGQRKRALEMFKRSEVQVLLATDVAARGLDIDNVTHVINYDAPASYEDYIHRIGRTGRADKKGFAITFVE